MNVLHNCRFLQHYLWKLASKYSYLWSPNSPADNVYISYTLTNQSVVPLGARTVTPATTITTYFFSHIQSQCVMSIFVLSTMFTACNTHTHHMWPEPGDWLTWTQYIATQHTRGSVGLVCDDRDLGTLKDMLILSSFGFTCHLKL